MTHKEKYFTHCKKLGLNNKESEYMYKIAMKKKNKQLSKKASLEKKAMFNDNFIAMVLLGV